MAKRPYPPDIVATTLVVAASDSLDPTRADYQCDGVNDDVEIQAALDALPAGGGEVILSEGTFNCEATINLDSNQTLSGCGWNTTLTTATADLVFLSAVGGDGSELTGINITDLQIDGGAGGISDCGIYFEFVDHSLIQNVYSRRHASGTGTYLAGICLVNSDSNTIKGNTCQENGYFGIDLVGGSFNIITDNTSQRDGSMGGGAAIYLNSSNNNIISVNTVQEHGFDGISLDFSNDNTISNNTVQGNSNEGITLGGSSIGNTVSDNTVQRCGAYGIYLEATAHNTIEGNFVTENSQNITNTCDNIGLQNSDYNNIQGNTCRAGALDNKPRYGINISDATCDKNVIIGNDLYDDGFGTGAFNDAGTLTHVEDNNRGVSLDQIKHFRRVQNTSGAQRVAGDVVSLKAVATGNEVTAPAAIGERQVYGMVAETIDDNAWGLVQVKGKTTVLKSTNAGGGNIVIGDFLITENGVRARKAAAATDPIFAQALEACAAANCTLDAYIVSPWD